MSRQIKKIAMLMLLSTVLLSGCGTEEVSSKQEKMIEEIKENKQETEVKEETKYSRLNEGLSEESMIQMAEEVLENEHLYFSADYQNDVICQMETNTEVIEEGLTTYYKTWYKEGTDEAVVIDKDVLMGKKYGVRYAFWIESESLAYEDYLYIALCFLEEPERLIEKSTFYDYKYLSEEDVFNYAILTIDGESYCSHSDSEIKAAEAEAKAYEEETVMAMQFESQIPDKTLSVAKEKIYAQLDSADKQTPYLHMAEKQECYTEYDSKNKMFTCYMTVVYYKDYLLRVFYGGETYYVTAKYKVIDGELVLVSFEF